MNKRFLILAAALVLVTLTVMPVARTADTGQMASPTNYLASVVAKLEQAWPNNHLVNIVIHGHSVPAGYFQTPAVDSLHAYPNLLRVALAKKYTNAIINVMVTAIGGEDSAQGAARFDADVLTHKPDVLFIDYGLNDRRIGLAKAKAAWAEMIQKALAAQIKVILLTPTPDQSAKFDDPNDPLNQHAEQIRQLAAEYHVGLVDSLARLKAALATGIPLKNLMAQVNHPNAAGHQLVAEELVKWFPSTPTPVRAGYADGRPAATLQLAATDAGVVLKHGDGPGRCDVLGARDVWVWESGGNYFMHYDGAGTNAWLACLATSHDLTNWTKLGPVLQLGPAGQDDSASASYGTTYFDGTTWQMFYLGTRHVTPAPNFIPSTPYVTMKAFASLPSGPWTKQLAVVPFRCQAGTYYSDTASPGFIVRQGDEYLMFFSAAKKSDGKLQRTLGLARTKNLDAVWTPDGQPIVPSTEQIENSSLYFEPVNQTWFLFCNHVGIENKTEFTDAVWIYWTKDLNHWNPDHKAVVLDGSNCRWSRQCIGLPSVVKAGNRLAIFYDAPGGDRTSHMKRDVGLAWLKLPLTAPAQPAAPAGGRDASITVDVDKPVHIMRGGIGASWHAIGPTPFYYPDLIGRDNRTCRGSAFGGNPPPNPKYEQAWKDLLHHARWLGLDFIRVEIDMRMYNPQRGEFTWDNEESGTLDRILQFCQTNQVDVYLTMMWQDVKWNAHPGICRLQSSPRSVTDFAESYATLLERLVKTKGYTCIRWVTVNNEPGMDCGWWQKADQSPDSIMPAIHALRASLDQRGLMAVAISGPDGHSLQSGQLDPQDPAVGALSLHCYGKVQTMDKLREAAKNAAARGIPCFLAEFGCFFAAMFEGDNMALGGPRSESPKSYSAQVLNAEKVLVGLNAGVDGFNRWSFVNRGDLDGQWQMVRTWNPNTWDFYQNVTPEPVPYFSYGILTRFTAKHSTVMLASSDDPEVIVAALRSPKGQTTIFILNKSDKERKATLQIAGLKDNLSMRQYQVTEAELLKPSFALAALATVNANAKTNHFTITLPGKSITAYTTFQLADDADGITQE